jgi:hypothetical protein
MVGRIPVRVQTPAMADSGKLSFCRLGGALEPERGQGGEGW